MGRVCLILPLSRAAVLRDDYVSRCRDGLRLAGHEVDVLAVSEPTEPNSADSGEKVWPSVVANSRGLSSAAMTGLSLAGETGDVDLLIVLDPSQGYDPDDLPLMVEPLVRGEAELTVARRSPRTADRSMDVDARSRPHRFLVAAFGKLTRPLLGASDVFGGLTALTPNQARAVTRSFEPVGARFTLDLLVRSKARRVEVLVRQEGPVATRGLGFDDLRHLKRLADDRFGNASRLIQFCAVGASGMVLDLTFYAIFQLIFSSTSLARMRAPVVGGPLDLAVAGALAIGLALTWNFSLNRRLTFSYARHGSTVRQFLTYALSNAVGIALSFSLRLSLPVHVDFFHRHKLAAAVVGIVTATGISFSMSRWLVFSRRSVARDLARAEARTASSI